MSNDLFLLATIAWLIGTTLFILYYLVDWQDFNVDEELLPEWEEYIMLDEEWLYLESPVYPYFHVALPTPLPSPMTREPRQTIAGPAIPALLGQYDMG
jgi:hypothetical protein